MYFLTKTIINWEKHLFVVKKKSNAEKLKEIKDYLDKGFFDFCNGTSLAENILKIINS